MRLVGWVGFAVNQLADVVKRPGWCRPRGGTAGRDGWLTPRSDDDLGNVVGDQVSSGIRWGDRF